MLEAQSTVMPSNLETLGCSRGLWVEYDLTYAVRDAGLLLEEATKQRSCGGYFKYKDGWSPEGHRELLLRSEDRVHDRVTNALFTVLGALLALFIQWLAKFLGLV